MKAFSLLAASALALAACAGGGEVPTRQAISQITVETDVQSIGNPGAVTYWQRLSSDLETALAAEFVNDISPDGAVLTVDVDEISLANSYTANFAGESSTLSGVVTLVDGRGAPLGTYNVTATSSQALASAPVPSGTTTVSPGSAEFYAGLVRAFARGVNTTVNSGV